MNEKYVKVDTPSILEMCQKIQSLENEKKELQQELKLVGSELTYFKEYAADLEEDVTALKAKCRTLSSENHELSLEIKDMKFTKKYLNSEDAGRQFARELLGRTTPEDIAEETFIANGEKHYYAQPIGDDF